MNASALLFVTFSKWMELKCSTKMSIASDTAYKNFFSSDLRDFQEAIIDTSCSDHLAISLVIPPSSTATGISSRGGFLSQSVPL